MLPDWADGIWLYTRDEEDDRRFLKVEGRGVGLIEGLVEIDEDGRTVYREVSRRDARINRALEDYIAYVAAHPGCTVTDAKGSLEVGNTVKDETARKAVSLGRVRQENDPSDKRRKLLYAVKQEDDF